MSGKGDKRRPTDTGSNAIAANWQRTFSAKRLSLAAKGIAAALGFVLGCVAYELLW